METQIDFETIERQVKEVIEYSQGFVFNQTNHLQELIKSWYEAKKEFIETMGSLIRESEEIISFSLSPDTQERLIDEYVDFIHRRMGYEEAAEFINDHRNGFFDNILDDNYKLNDGSILPKGMKLLKCLKFFISNQVALEEIQNEGSRIIQENKVSGYLCVSVHPLDYLSSSENAHNWRSCHALDGEYRGGNLSYMLDNSTVICYLRAKEPEYKISRFPDSVKWNSKKWRMLVHFSEDRAMVFAGRQYPFTSENALSIVGGVLNEAFKKDNFWNSSDWYCDKMKSFKFAKFSQPLVPVGNSMVPMPELISKPAHALNYNDILHSSCYDPYYSYHSYNSPYAQLFGDFCGSRGGTGISDEIRTRFVIGSDVLCPNCGNVIEETDGLLCRDCHNNYGEDEREFTTCDNCGSAIDGAEYWLPVEGATVCAYCYENATSVCPICDNRYFNDNLYFDEKLDKYICHHCLNNREG